MSSVEMECENGYTEKKEESNSDYQKKSMAGRDRSKDICIWGISRIDMRWRVRNVMGGPSLRYFDWMSATRRQGKLCRRECSSTTIFEVEMRNGELSSDARRYVDRRSMGRLESLYLISRSRKKRYALKIRRTDEYFTLWVVGVGT